MRLPCFWSQVSSLYAETGQYEGFLQTIVNSGYMDMLTNAGYGVGRGSWTAGTIDGAALPASLSDAQIRGYLQSYLSAGYVAAPDANRLYMVFVEPNVVVQMGGGESVHNFLGYHGAFTGANAYGQAVIIHYAVMAYPGGSVHNAIVPGLTDVQSQTKVASHELVEAATDPDIGYSTLGWYDNTYNEEVGDLANTKFGSYLGYVVQYQVNQNDQYIFPTTNTASTLPGDSYNVVSFQGDGLWRLGTTWQQLTPVTPSALAVNAYGDVAAAFPGSGTWEYVESTQQWLEITTVTATQVGIDDDGDVAADFGASGLWRWTYGGNWQELTPSQPTLIAMGPNGNVAASFNGSGVWRFADNTGWQRLTNLTASILKIDANGNLLTDLPGAGVWRFNDSTGWQQLTNVDAVTLGFDHFGDVSAVFRGAGTWIFSDVGGWRQITASEAYTTTFDSKGYLLADFTGSGLFRYSSDGGWVQVTPYDVALLA